MSKDLKICTLLGHLYCPKLTRPSFMAFVVGVVLEIMFEAM